jgi:hypothetical protein
MIYDHARFFVSGATIAMGMKPHDRIKERTRLHWNASDRSYCTRSVLAYDHVRIHLAASASMIVRARKHVGAK